MSLKVFVGEIFFSFIAPLFVVKGILDMDKVTNQNLHMVVWKKILLFLLWFGCLQYCGTGLSDVSYQLQIVPKRQKII